MNDTLKIVASPGKPTIVVQNVPAAGGMALANQLYNTAPRDGTIIGAITNGMPTAPILSPDTAKFDLMRQLKRRY